MARFAGRSAIAHDERGQGLVEFALILPVLLLILVGILEFGSVYSKVISMRQGVREAGRQGSVANWGTPCNPGTLEVGATGSANIQRLMCLAKDQAGVGSGVKMRVRFADANLNPANTTELSSGYVAGNAILVCAVYPLQSLTGLMQPILNGRYAKTKAAFRIEKVDAAGATGGGETDPSGATWNWCA
jgi:hypothetical protein